MPAHFVLLFPPVTTPAPSAEPAPSPDPHQGRPAVHARTIRILALVRGLIIFGKTLAIAVRGHPTGETGQTIGSRFGTRSVARILARISRGLRLAAELETRLADRAAQSDAQPTIQHPPRSRRPHSPGAPCSALPRDSAESSFTNLPTVQELARQFRQRPVHTVLLDIAYDLGLDRLDPLWQQVEQAIFELTRSMTGTVKNLGSRRASLLRSILPNLHRLARPGLPQLSQEFLASYATKPTTGPPWPSAQFRKA